MTFFTLNDAKALPCGCIEVHHTDTVHEFFEAPTYRNSRLPISPTNTSPCAVEYKHHGGLFSSFFSLFGCSQHHKHHLHLGGHHSLHAGGFFSSGSLLVKGLVARYVASLVARPLLTKAYTAGTLSFVQEVLTNHLAGVKFHTHHDDPAYKRLLARLKIDSTALKMAAYGFFVSAPLGHYLNLMMLKSFAGRTSKKARFAQFLTQFFFVAPVNVFVYLVSMAIIGGAKSQTHIRAHVHRGFAKMLAFTWLVQPTALFAARRWVPLELWSPFFQLVNFSLGTYFLTRVKKVQVLKAEEDDRKKRPDTYRPGPSVIQGHGHGASGSVSANIGGASVSASGYVGGVGQSNSVYLQQQGGYQTQSGYSEQHSSSHQEANYTRSESHSAS